MNGLAGEMKRMRPGLVVGLVVVGVVLVLIAVSVPLALAVTKSKPEGVVTDYLTAVKEGDFDTAISFVPEDERGDLLTEPVLAKSVAADAFHAFFVDDVREVGDRAWRVPVRYVAGVGTYHDEFVVRDTDDGLVIDNPTISIDAPAVSSLGFTLNGVRVTKPEQAFPGLYQSGVTSPYLQVQFDGQTRLESLDTFPAFARADTEEFAANLRIGPGKLARTEAKRLFRANVKTCLAMRTATTPCGMEASSFSQQTMRAVPNTFQRELGGMMAFETARLHVAKGGTGTKFISDPMPVTVRYRSPDTGAMLPDPFAQRTLAATYDFSGATPKFRWGVGK